MTSEARAFLEDRSHEIRRIEREAALAYWDASRSGSTEDFNRVAELEKEEVDLYARREDYDRTRRLLEACDAALERRQLELLERRYRACQGDATLLKEIVEQQNELTRLFNNHRAEFRGERHPNNHLEGILRHGTDPDEAREAWQALKQVGALAAPRVAELARLRNRQARELGFPDYYRFALDQNELDVDRLFRLIDDLERRSDPLFRDFKRELDQRLADEYGIDSAALRPWHYRNPFFQDLPPAPEQDLDALFEGKSLETLTRDFYADIGIDIAPLLEAADLYEREGKDQSAFCLAVESPQDVRVLCNLVPGTRWMSTMLHEFGHAAYDQGIDAELPYLLRHPSHTLTTEAVAMWAERFLADPLFLERRLGIEPAESARRAGNLRRDMARRRLVFCRWAMVMMRFERGLYEDPDRDLPALWWETVGRLQGLEAPERAGQPDWAAKVHLAGAPAYYQNYLLGEMTASQFQATLEKQLESRPVADCPETGRFLTEQVFRAGASLRWDRHLARATGAELDPAHFLRDLEPNP